ncbi:unknown [Haloarcula marismortui ATCC 43049]|uniref:Uncharacterized protein n=1 Tax=Haloarcula marismortui (strain ATCC 43049 / DSM 3752 / JCM 8966 / VKM B-1809) TaxID=272569 RepID=Q5V042_HALMA|nr:hypothetical protein [Haloarcula marismortui]AAV47111.1 unknown [Haloarcula marismortui ATCC 43049]QCP91813.1 hypothetical protein E6P14_13455 [Haloarcula marismortui ATCC 43049]
MPETGSTASTFFLPVLILVIVQFAKVAREADLTTIVKEEHPPLLISPITSILFAIIRGITWGLFTSLVVKLVSDSIEARLQSIFYERLRPLLEPIHSIQREALERITGSDIKDESERIQFLLHFRRLRPRILPSLPMMLFHQKPDPEIPQEQIRTVEEMRIRTIDLIYAAEARLTPNLGRFVFIHGINNVLLVLGLVFSTTLLTDIVLLISGSLTVLVWSALPVFEIDEYDLLLSDDTVVFSLPTHILFVSLTCIIIYGAGNSIQILIPIVDISFSFQYSLKSALVIVGLLTITSVWTFSTILEGELKNTINI